MPSGLEIHIRTEISDTLSASISTSPSGISRKATVHSSDAVQITN